jgi:PAS domain S-box-containing protein
MARLSILGGDEKRPWTKDALKILDSISVPILIIDRNLTTIGANQAACRQFCFSKEEIIGQPCYRISHGIDSQCSSEETTCPTKLAFELRKQTRVIHEHRHDGKTVFEEIVATPMLDQHGEVEYVVEEVNNVTELVQSKEITEHLKKDVKVLQGLLPICARCKNIRDEEGYWNQIETYLSIHTEVEFSHGICTRCREALYGKEKWYIDAKKRRQDRAKD